MATDTSAPSPCPCTPPPRRGFLRTTLAAAAALLFWPRRAFAKTIAIGLDKLPALAKVGGSVSIKVKEQPLLFIRDSKDHITVLDPTCTHKKCIVAYSDQTKQIHCECHKSAYALDGKVLDGPAPAPLTVFKSKLDGARVLVALPENK